MRLDELEARFHELERHMTRMQEEIHATFSHTEATREDIGRIGRELEKSRRDPIRLIEAITRLFVAAFPEEQ